MIGWKLEADGSTLASPCARRQNGASGDDPVVSVRGVVKSHVLKNGATVRALDGVDLDVRNGEFLTIVGPSGCGKSTLLNLLAGLTAPDAGAVSFRGEHGHDVRRHLGYVSQVDALLPWRTILGNVEIGLELRGVPKKERREAARALMRQTGLQGFERCYPFELSGGMRKRAAVIRTLAYDPDVIFMDEPFVGLDVQTRDELEEDILALWRKRRKTIVLVTHDLAEAITLSDRVALMTARPGMIKAVHEIDLPRPRSAAQTKFSPAFVRLHREIWESLRAEVVKGTEGTGGTGHA